MFLKQKTIKKKLIIEGIGLHTGLLTKIILEPADIDRGIFFYRSDLKKSSPIKANWSNVIKSNLCTKISNLNGDTVSTIEHLMFAFYSLGITNLLVKINSPEVPVMDGSAKPFINEILKIGLIEQNKAMPKININNSFEVKIDEKFIKYQPSQNKYLEIDYSINYNDNYIKRQNLKFLDAKKNYAQIYDCRTFCHQEDLEKIFAMGLARGGSLDNAIVISGNKILNQDGLRYKDEFVRHKILDCIGDLYLSGFFISGKIICNQGGHELTASLLKKIFEKKGNYSIEKKLDDNSKIQINKKLLKNKNIHAVV